MNLPSNLTTTMSVDLKKYRIRLHKSALHLLGDPKYIQLLVNPQEMVVAILPVEKSVPGNQVHAVSQLRMQSDESVEIYSQSFIKKLCNVIGGLDGGHTYHISGVVLQRGNVALYSLKTIKRVGK